MASLKSCPLCGNGVYISKNPLWQTYANGGTHGYFGCFEYVIECENPRCKCRIDLGQNTTII